MNLSTLEEVPDEENFCVIPWLTANDDGGVLNFGTDEPQSTKFYKPDYLGDWPWPVVPREPVEVDP